MLKLHVHLLARRWVKNSRMGGLKFDWHILISSYFLIAAVHFSPQEADARAAWTKASFIGTIIDDIFDVDGSREELSNIIELVEKYVFIIIIIVIVIVFIIIIIIIIIILCNYFEKKESCYNTN